MFVVVGVTDTVGVVVLVRLLRLGSVCVMF